jgi:OmcA/MtrC family decaheme c-type cytochrome
MRRIPLALALIGAVAVTGCMSGSKAPAAKTDSDVQKGVTGSYFFVNLFSKPVGGVISSTDGVISCGATGITVQADALGVLQYVPTGYYAGADKCGQAQYPWFAADGTTLNTVTLNAVAQGGNEFLGWAGDCSGYGSCTVTAGADKSVVAVFGKPGTGHPNFMDPALHGPAVSVSSLACATCHGDQLQGQGNAPACTTCHNGTIAPVPPPPGPFKKTGLQAAITSVTPANTPANTVVTFTLKDNTGANVDLTGADGKNWAMPITLGIMNFGKDANGNAMPYKSGTGGNPATVTAYSAITPSNGAAANTLTSGTLPANNTFLYDGGTLTQGATVCTKAAPCTCSAATPCVWQGDGGTQGGRACTAAAPCSCTALNPCSPALPTVDGPGMLTYTGGVYKFTFAASPFPAVANALLNNTHTAWIATYRREDVRLNSVATSPIGALNGQAYSAENEQFNFNANTGVAVTEKREIVSDATCRRCHDGFKSPDLVSDGFHSAARIGANYCNVCHYEGRGTYGFADSATFIHRIHAGKDLTKVTSGPKTTGYQAPSPFVGGTPVACSTAAPCTCTVLQPCSDFTFHGIAVTYPQDYRNCKECHDPALAQDGGQHLTRPHISACGACHDQLAATFLPSAGLSLPAHPASAPAVQTDATCASCHSNIANAAYIGKVHVPVVPPAADSCLANNNSTTPACNANTNAAFIAATGVAPAGASIVTFEIGTVGTYLDATVPPGVYRPQMTVRMLKDGVVTPFNVASKPELIPNFIGSPSLYWVWSQSQDGIAAPADFNASASVYLRNLWAGIVLPATATLSSPDADGFYTVQLKAVVIPSTAALLTGGIGYSYNNTSSLPMTQTNVPGFPVTNVSITAGKINGITCTVPAPCAAQTGGLIVPSTNVRKVAAGFTGRREVVANAKCDACHGKLGVEPTFHAGQRNDAPSCSWCHNPNRTSSAWSANASTFIHGIHAASKRSVNFNWHAACQFGATWDNTAGVCVRATVAEGPSIFYPEVEYPGYLRDCKQCHVEGGFDFSANAGDVPSLLPSTVATGTYAAAGMATSPYVTADGATSYGSGFSVAAATGIATPATSATLVSSPIAAACFSCHDTASAKAHIVGKGGLIYAARGTGFVAAPENCLGCHGKGKTWAVDLVH